MGQSLKEIAQQLKKDSEKKKVQLIYAFNGIGKTRLSRAFKELVAPKAEEAEEHENNKIKVLYYNAFTEDLFYWDNDLNEDTNRKLIIRPNNFTNWIFKDQGQEDNITRNFQRYTSDKLTPHFDEEYTQITFTIEGGNDEKTDNIKISKGEESCLVWCIFYSLLEEVVNVLDIAEPEERETNQFDDLEYVFIDDPVSSLDENHLIELAVNLAELIKRSSELKFIISTHNAVFYNILYNELNLNRKSKGENKCCYLLDKKEDGKFTLTAKIGDSNKIFSYHHYLIHIIKEALDTGNVQKYHFMLLRNLYEKTANFLGYDKWSKLLPDDKTTYYNRIIQFTSHSTLSNDTVAEPSNPEKNTIKFLFEHLVNSVFWKEKEDENI